MDYEIVYGPTFPCPCGNGTLQYSRVAHETLRRREGVWDNVDIECTFCSIAYVTRRIDFREWYCVPVMDAIERGDSGRPPGRHAVSIPNPDW